MCTLNQNCVISEFGVVSSTGKPYPSTGLASTYVMAHEIGHKYVVGGLADSLIYSQI